MTTQSIQSSNTQLWMAAIKPPMYSVAIIPIWVGTAVAVAETHRLQISTFSIFLLSAIFIIAWLNLSNDVFDSDTGIDKNKAHSVVNLTGNKSLVFGIANLFLILGILGIVGISIGQKDPTVLGIVILCCGLGYTYQGPPFRFGYLGLGEVICFFTFGPLAVAAAYYSQTQAMPIAPPSFGPLLAASIFVGITTSLILFCSHFHQVEDDLAAGKKSPIVRLGTEKGAKLLPISIGIVFGLTVVCVFLEIFPVWTLLCFASLPFAIKLCQHVGTYHDRPEIVSNSKFIAVSLHFLSGLLLGIGFILPVS
ncbi:MAG: 2-carboxy-1,4-naphthoquinone phytyltransferase [Geitlerinemataceae cyanobacterium]